MDIEKRLLEIEKEENEKFKRKMLWNSRLEKKKRAMFKAIAELSRGSRW